MNATGNNEDDPQMGFKDETQMLSGDLISFLNLFGRIINKTLGDIIGGE